MYRRRKIKYESLTIRQAQHKNCAEDAQLQVVKKFLNSERRRLCDEIDKARKQVSRTLEGIKSTVPVPGEVISRFHEDQKKNIQDVCLHIVNCYMQKQDRNKEKYLSLMKSKDIREKLPQERPVTTPDHLIFVHNAFPETYNMPVGNDWAYEKAGKVDIYEHGRAGHDMKCLSTRAKPTGGYPTRGPVNFRFWQPPAHLKPLDVAKEEGRKEVRRRRQHREKKSKGDDSDANNIIYVPSMGLTEVKRNSVVIFKNNEEDDPLNIETS